MQRARKPVKLPCRQIFVLARQVSQQHGLRTVSSAAIRSMYDATYPLPLHTRGEKGELWVDKYYIAYRLGRGRVHYVYLARAHIREEVTAFKQVSKARRCKVLPPDDVLANFRRAYRVMKAEGVNIWVLPEITVPNSK